MRETPVDYVKTDSGIFYIITVDGNAKLHLYPFPTNHEYLEMMSANDLFLHYLPVVARERMIENVGA